MKEATPPPPFTHWTASQMKPTTGAWTEKRRLAAAMRRVIGRLVEIDAPEDELARAADGLERYAETLEGYPSSTRYEGWAEAGPAGNTAAFFDQSPIIGQANPLSPPLYLQADTENKRVTGTGTFGSAYEGPPGFVHGGWIAAAFDELLGFANSLSGSPGMTGTLKVRYLRPTPLHTELRFEAVLDRTEGRKIFTSGQLYAGQVQTAEAHGLFISVDRKKFRAFFEERMRREAERTGSDRTK